jgi:hypothetical protein
MKVSDENSLMSAECMSEGISGELITNPDFGCIEFAEMPPGWDHYRLYRYERIGDETRCRTLPDDDMAHVEGRVE